MKVKLSKGKARVRRISPPPREVGAAKWLTECRTHKLVSLHTSHNGAHIEKGKHNRVHHKAA